MIRNYLITAYRNLVLHRYYTAVNILGLSVGIAACLLIVLFVKDELSFDRFNVKADRIYRVAVDGLFGNTVITQTATCPPLAGTSMKEFPEIEDAVRMVDFNKPLINYEQKSFTNFSVFACDSSIFKVFTIPILQGSALTALNQPNTAVITESMAKKIFGRENPLDRKLNVLGLNVRITAVIKNIPKNSHIHFDILINLTSFSFSKSTDWWGNSMLTYYLLKENSNYQALEAKLPEMQKKYMGLGGESFEKWTSKGNKWRYYLQPLTQIHLTTENEGVTVTNNNMVYVYIFSIVAIFILTLACVNFTNLTIAKASLRYKESGVRKAIGSKRSSLILQFLTESFIIALFATILGVLIVKMSIHWFNQITDKTLSLELFSTWYNIPFLFGIAVITGFVAGFFPAFQMSTYKTIDLISNKKNKAVVRFGSREVLIVFQFFISICLTISTVFVYKQLKFIQNKKLGFDKENVIVIAHPGDLQKKLSTFKEEIQTNPRIISSTVSSSAPGLGFINQGCIPEGYEKNKFITLNKYFTDFDFPGTYRLEISKGRFFSKEFSTDSSGILINECAAKLLDWKNPIGKKISFSDNENYQVLGIIKDYHYESLQNEIRPACIVTFNKYYNYPGILSVRIAPQDVSKTIAFLKLTWKKYANGVPFEFSFLDENLESLYKKEKRISEALYIFAVLAIFLACLGLLGLVSYMTERKTKEIGIRKINGSPSFRIFLTLAINFNKWVAIAFIIACPIAWYAMHKWLQNFAYKTELSWWVFAVAGIVAVAVALLTVSWQSWRAATRNPVESLRYE